MKKMSKSKYQLIKKNRKYFVERRRKKNDSYKNR